MRSILVPTDGSRGVRLAIDRAVELASALGAKVTGLYVVDRATFAAIPGEFEWDYLARALREEGERALGDVRASCETHHVPVETRLEEGHPAQAIIDAAQDFDLVVMGTLGRGGLAHLLLGSVAERVIRHAPCPVMVVRIPRSAARA